MNKFVSSVSGAGGTNRITEGDDEGQTTETSPVRTPEITDVNM